MPVASLLQEYCHASIATATGKDVGVENIPTANQHQVESGGREAADLGKTTKPGEEDDRNTIYPVTTSVSPGDVPGLKDGARLGRLLPLEE